MKFAYKWLFMSGIILSMAGCGAGVAGNSNSGNLNFGDSGSEPKLGDSSLCTNHQLPCNYVYFIAGNGVESLSVTYISSVPGGTSNDFYSESGDNKLTIAFASNREESSGVATSFKNATGNIALAHNVSGSPQQLYFYIGVYFYINGAPIVDEYGNQTPFYIAEGPYQGPWYIIADTSWWIGEASASITNRPALLVGTSGTTGGSYFIRPNGNNNFEVTTGNN